MKVIDVVFEDFVNYKKPSMVIEFPYCTFKCNHECGKNVCQNYQLKDSEVLELEPDDLISEYSKDPVTEAVVMQGLEPFDSMDDVIAFIDRFRDSFNDDIVIYTGYNEDEIDVSSLKKYKNITVKYGRYIPGQTPHFDKELGVMLYSDNQYSKRIS